jgi:phospholipid/cholesterol/gamma-HCH transport system ATP-binding protein
VSSDGGLISNLRVGENLILPAAYHSGLLPESFEKKIVAMLEELGYDKAADNRLLAKLPADLSAFERRLVSFIRAAILEPAVIVYDSLWADLPAHEFERVSGFDTIFRKHCQTSVSIYLHSGAGFPFNAAFNQTFVL